MDNHDHVRKLTWFINGLVVLMFFIISSTVSAQSLPGAATPGGIDPARKGVMIPEAKKLPDVYIPPINDRPLDVDEGVQILVNDFVISGLNDLEHSSQAFKDIWEAITSYKRLPATYTIGQLQLLADNITKYLRGQGHILAHAFIPEQTVESGIINIRILVGKLGIVTSEDNDKYSDRVLNRIFKPLLDKPVNQKDIESAMLYVMKYPGLDVTGVFSKGEEVGETKLTLKVQDEKPFEFSLSTDNYGSEYTGLYRVRLDASLNNPVKLGDQLNLTVLQGLDPEETTYGAFNYKVPLPNFHYTVGIGGEFSTYGVVKEFKTLGIDGEVWKANAFVERSFINQKDLGLSAVLDFSRKQSKSTQNNSQFDTEDGLSVGSFAINADCMDYVFEKIGIGGGISTMGLTYSHGFGDFLDSMDRKNATKSSRLGGSGEYAGGEFDKVNLALNRLQYIGKGLSCLMRFEGQWSEDLMVSLEQFSLSGPDRVRAYEPAELMRDKAWFGSVEFMLNSSAFYDEVAFNNYSWAEILQLSVFFDYADGRLNDPLGNEVEDALYGAGVGLRFSIPGRFLFNISAATPLGSYTPSDGKDDCQIYFSSTLYF